MPFGIEKQLKPNHSFDMFTTFLGDVNVMQMLSDGLLTLQKIRKKNIEICNRLRGTVVKTLAQLAFTGN